MNDTIYAAVGLAILLIAMTISVVMGVVAWKLLQLDEKASLAEWQSGLTAGSVALFGTLIAGVFVITTFRIDRYTEQTARTAAATATEEAGRALARQRVGGRVGFERDESAFEEAQDLEAGDSSERSFGSGQRLTFRLVVPEGSEYQIDVEALTEGFDPVLHVYGQIDGGNDWAVSHYDDDGGEGYNSRLSLQAGMYRVEVEELVGTAGRARISVSTL